MSRPAAALSSELLVRKGAAHPFVDAAAASLLERDWPVRDISVAPAPAWTAPPDSEEGMASAALPRRRSLLADGSRLWRLAGRRWSLPTGLLLGGLAMILVVATIGPQSNAVSAASVSQFVALPPGPTPVTWAVQMPREPIAGAGVTVPAGR